MIIGSFFCRALTAALCMIPAHGHARRHRHPSIDPNTTHEILTASGIWGLYVDDTTPNPCAVVASDRARGWRNLVLGVAPGAVQTRCRGAINAQEWYPWDCRYPPGSWGAIPHERAYILQARFAWPGCGAPTVRQRIRLLHEAERQHPRLILWY
jgi:hypothetical protein